MESYEYFSILLEEEEEKNAPYTMREIFNIFKYRVLFPC